MPRKNNILIRSGTTVPSANDFNVGEPAYDKSAGRLYIKNAAGTMAEIGAGGGGGISDPYDLGSYPLLTISAQPGAASVSDGESATFSLTAAATLPAATIAYQWQRSTDSGATWANVSGATSSSYSFTAATSQTGYRYRCSLTAGLSSVDSSSATLTVSGGTPGFAVSGAGTAAANGTYCQSGTLNGRPRYTNGAYSIEYTSDWIINDEGSGPNWLIRSGGTDLYYASVTAATPPLSGWGVFSGGSPAPTLSSTTCG